MKLIRTSYVNRLFPLNTFLGNGEPEEGAGYNRCVAQAYSWGLGIGVSGSFFRGGQQLHPAKIQSFPAKISSCQGGAMCSAKLLYQAFLPSCPANGQKWKINGCKTGKSGGKTGKYGRNQPKVAETRQKMTEKVAKWEVLQIVFCQACHFCPAKLPFLSCQAPIYVLPS